MQGIETLKKGGYIQEEDYKTEEVRINYVDKTYDMTYCPFCKSNFIGKIKGFNIITPLFYFISGVIIPIFNSKYKRYDCEKEWKYS